MIPKTMTRIGLFLFYRQYEVGELLLGLLGVIWGLWILNPFIDPFELEFYNSFLCLAPGWVWGLGVFLIGLFTIIAAVCKHKYYFRATALLINIFLWSFIASRFLVAVYASTGFPVYFIVALTAVWLYLRLTIFNNMIDEVDLAKIFDRRKGDRRKQ